MDFHDPQIDVAVMVLGAVIMAFALLRFRVLSETVPASDLRKFLIQTLQRHIEKKLVTAGMLDKLSA